MTEVLDDMLPEYRWQPVFDRPVELAEVAVDARSTLEQMAHLSRVVVGMHVSTDEAAGIVEALQLCERLHGYARIADAVGFVAGAVETAIAMTGTTITRVAQQRGYRGPGLLAGHLVEDRAGIEHIRRHFPATTYQPRLSSPFVEFEDCWSGAGIAECVKRLSEIAPFTALVAAFRRSSGRGGQQFLEEAAASAGTLMAPLDAFVGAIHAEAKRAGVRLPAQWLRFERMRSRRL